MKKFFIAISTIIAAALLVLGTLGCSFVQKGNDDSLDIIVTNFAEYDWVKSLMQGVSQNYTITFINEGSDLHGYEPSVSDIAKIADSDVLIYVGGESDEWIDDMLSQPEFSKLTTINLLEALDDKGLAEDTPQGFEGDSDESEHEHDGHEHEAAGEELDEHVWLSLLNTREVFIPTIGYELEAQVNASSDKKMIRKRVREYAAQLWDLHTAYLESTKTLQDEPLIFADRYPFAYMAHDYNLDTYAAFPGCSAESEASFATIENLSQQLDKNMRKVLIVLEQNDNKIAQQVVEVSKSGISDVMIVTMNSMQLLTSADAETTSYIQIMEENLEALRVIGEYK